MTFETTPNTERFQVTYSICGFKINFSAPGDRNTGVGCRGRSQLGDWPIRSNHLAAGVILPGHVRLAKLTGARPIDVARSLSKEFIAGGGVTAGSASVVRVGCQLRGIAVEGNDHRPVGLFALSACRRCAGSGCGGIYHVFDPRRTDATWDSPQNSCLEIRF